MAQQKEQRSTRAVVKVEAMGMGIERRNTLERWKVIRSRRTKRTERMLFNWAQIYGTNNPCTICALDHTALLIQLSQDGQRQYHICCPISSRDVWPPAEPETTLWEGLEPSPEKFARLYHYDTDSIKTMLEIWETSLFSLVLSRDECQEFKEEVIRITDDVRQSWTFKRPIMYFQDYSDNDSSDDESLNGLIEQS